ncbi:MAG: hypothetical protein H7Z21_06980 [Hymenobacter sp.]|nr:hypothetical protein [Hymenobacter sp.]
MVVHEVMMTRPELLQTSQEARQIVSYHALPEDAGRVFARVKPRLAVFTHVALLSTDPAISPPQATEIVPRTRSTYAGPLELGEDLLSVEIGAEITVRRFEPKK